MNLTRYIIAVLVAGILLLDIVLAVVLGIDATISVQITAWSHEYPVIPFAFGCLCGHFFMQNQKGAPPSPPSCDAPHSRETRCWQCFHGTHG